MIRSKLTENKKTEKGIILANNKDYPFIIAITSELEKQYNFACINKHNGYKEFQKFLDDTVGKNLTISEVDKRFLRTKGKKEYYQKGNINTTLHHYGKDRTAFRIFGYYNTENNYFVLTKIDCCHKVHNE